MATPTTVLALGEVLWDVFQDGPRFGGAPANFACACAGLGRDRVRAALVSAVGNDPLGEEAVARLAAHGVDTSLVARTDRSTGQVFVTLDDAGRATYRFVEDPAWDHLTATPELLARAGGADVVYFGTLGQRGDVSRAAIRAAVAAAPPECIRILDLNLRPPHWSADVIRAGLEAANVLKLNDEELPTLAGVLGVGGAADELLRAILTRYSLRLIALTRGENGSVLLAGDGSRSDAPGVRVDVVDTVGAGDAFTAAVALGLAHGLPLERINRWAGEVAAFVCTQPGGAPAFPERLQLPS